MKQFTKIVLATLIATVLITLGAGWFVSRADISNPHPVPPSNSVTGAMLKNNIIQDYHIASSAAISYSKLSLSGKLVNGDISNSAAISLDKLADTANYSRISSGTQTIAGVKTFSSFPEVPSGVPTDNNSAVGYGFFQSNSISIATSSPAVTVLAASQASSTSIGSAGSVVSWTVPNGVSQITVSMKGGDSNAGPSGIVGSPVGGGYATGTLVVTPGTTYYFMVGKNGDITCPGTPGGAGGVNSNNSLYNGAIGGCGSWFGTASSFSTSTVLMVAGGAGGNGGTRGVSGGAGGVGSLPGADGGTGTTGSTPGGKGGTNTTPGIGGAGTGGGGSGVSATSTMGGAGGAAVGQASASGGGGGGGGYYAGGGGGGSAVNNDGGGGGGGSNFFSSSLTATSTAPGPQTGDGSDGLIKINYNIGSTASGSNYGGLVTVQVATASSSIVFGTPFNNQVGCIAMSDTGTGIIGTTTLSKFIISRSGGFVVGEHISYTCL